MNMSPKENRISRDDETREAEAREMDWVPPNALPDPHPRPGLVYRWVRTATMGQPDVVNVSQSLREGWVPVSGADYPELKVLTDHGTRWPDGIEVGGLLLCSTSAALAARRQDYYRRMTRAQMQSVNDQLAAEQDPRFPTFTRSHETTISRGFGPQARERNGAKT